MGGFSHRLLRIIDDTVLELTLQQYCGDVQKFTCLLVILMNAKIILSDIKFYRQNDLCCFEAANELIILFLHIGMCDFAIQSQCIIQRLPAKI